MRRHLAGADPKWNNDWDGAALMVDDVLIEGGENG